MANFESLFAAAEGQPVCYQGREIRLADTLIVRKGDRFRVVFEGADSEWRQAIVLKSRGPMLLAGLPVRSPVVLWFGMTRAVHLVMEGDGELTVMNGWDSGRGVLESGRDGAAMIVDETPARRRYRCNDGYPDDDFNDLVFRIERELR
jgi:hypothetical protein